MKKLAFLLLAVGGIAAIAATCVIRGATITVIDDEVWYSAEMDNETEADILDHRFAVGFIENFGLVASKTVDGCLRSLNSNMSNFYSANSGLEEDEVDTAVTRLVGPITFGMTASGDISFDDIEATRDDDVLTVSGTITNDDTDDLEDAMVCVVVRNEDGDITIVEQDNAIDLDEDETANFSVDVTVPDESDDVDKVDLWVDAINPSEDDKPTEPQSELGTDVELGTATATPTITSTATPTSTPTP